MNQVVPVAKRQPPTAAAQGRAWLDQCLATARLLQARQPLIEWLNFRRPATNAAQAREHLSTIALDGSSLLDEMTTFRDAATEGAAEPRTVGLAVSLMLDGYPSLKPVNPTGYARALTFAVADECFSPMVLAAAVVRTWRELKFAPAPSEFLATCRRVRREFQKASEALGRVYDLRLAAEEVLVAAGELSFHETTMGQLIRDGEHAE